MNVVLRWLKIFVVMFPGVMVLNQCGYNNCYRAYCIAAAMGHVTLLTLFLSLGLLVVFVIRGR